ncbi:helix-turn-helix domain-containing protein [Oribacterium sp. NK2B42]|uniref:helix-turn-helix domain-containing protein n=1 Tax=Oribacterium sp. NK2B42 TaxID=689781 RepID=UPI000420ED89|nr:helix-turn-helix transcriptional regulator [Oribacterium sp. NK2B42]
MTADALDGLKSLDREALMEKMAEELPDIRRQLNVTQEALAEKTGVDVAKIKAAENGKRSFKWSEFMSILFVIWNNDIGKGILDSKGLFPDELKKALSVNRNAHAPMTESMKYGF